uniref:Uncharacterized protein n=1 Tax=Acrobeloides nanus TaxID=290746 RepID=A0A914BYB5_9BILA
MVYGGRLGKIMDKKAYVVGFVITVNCGCLYLFIRVINGYQPNREQFRNITISRAPNLSPFLKSTEFMGFLFYGGAFAFDLRNEPLRFILTAILVGLGFEPTTFGRMHIVVYASLHTPQCA